MSVPYRVGSVGLYETGQSGPRPHRDDHVARGLGLYILLRLREEREIDKEEKQSTLTRYC